jgi:hypothetical protein
VATQERLERDMLDAAFLERLGAAASAVRRAAPPANGLAAHWMRATHGAVGLLQDSVLFREEDLTSLSAAGTCKWLPGPSVVNSLLQLAGVLPAAESAGGARPGAAPWAPTLLLALPSETALLVAMRLQSQLLHHAVLRSPAGPSKASRQRPKMDVANMVQSLGEALALQVDVQATNHARGLAVAATRTAQRAMVKLAAVEGSSMQAASADVVRWRRRASFLVDNCLHQA